MNLGAEPWDELVQAGQRVRYFTAAELVETLNRGLADNSVGKVTDNLLRLDFVVMDAAFLRYFCHEHGYDVLSDDSRR